MSVVDATTDKTAPARTRRKNRRRKAPRNRSVLEMKWNAEMQGEQRNAANMQLDYGDRPYG